MLVERGICRKNVEKLVKCSTICTRASCQETSKMIRSFPAHVHVAYALHQRNEARLKARSSIHFMTWYFPLMPSFHSSWLLQTRVCVGAVGKRKRTLLTGVSDQNRGQLFNFLQPLTSKPTNWQSSDLTATKQQKGTASAAVVPHPSSLLPCLQVHEAKSQWRYVVLELPWSNWSLQLRLLVTQKLLPETAIRL